MFRNYFKIAYRNLIRFKSYSFINIFGLAIGFCACIFIALWIQNELTFNKFNRNFNDIYRVLTKHYYGSQQSWSTGSPPAVGPAMKEHYPEVLNYCRIQNGTNSLSVKYLDKLFKEEIQMADPSVFEVFSFPLSSGSYQEAFNNIYTIILSEKMAQKYFETENPIGRKLLVDNKYELEVIGVMKEIPENSTISFEFLVPLEILNDIHNKGNTETWYNCSFNTFITMIPGVDYIDFREKSKSFITDNYSESDTEPYVYPFSKEYLYLYGRKGIILIVGIIGAIILLIACINFVNLSTSFALKRSREVGLRKLVGAGRKHLIIQFFIESILIVLISIIIGLALLELMKPIFEGLVEVNIRLFTPSNLIYLSGIPIVAVLIGCLAGFYPAIVLSSFRTLTTIKRSTHMFGGKSIIRKVLVTFQFALSIILIICTIIIAQQSEFMIQKDLGYNKDYLVYVPLQGQIKENPELYRQQLLQNTNIKNICLLGRNPSGIWTNGSGWEWEGKPEELDPFVTYQGVDHEYLETFQIKMLQGEFYTENSDGSTCVVINESFAKNISDENPVGMSLSHNDENYKILGVTKNFHFKSAHHRIGAIVMYFNNKNAHEMVSFKYAFMRLDAKKISETLKFIETTTRSLIPDYPYQIDFLEQDIENLYHGEVQSKKLITSFAILAVFISCLGLLGLSTLITQQRVKEIGIRKVLGSSIVQIIALLTNQFVKWILLANIIAWPISYHFMNIWLQNFPYKVELRLIYFIIAGLIAVLIAIATVSYNTLRAASCNPVEVLKYE